MAPDSQPDLKTADSALGDSAPGPESLPPAPKPRSKVRDFFGLPKRPWYIWIPQTLLAGVLLAPAAIFGLDLLPGRPATPDETAQINEIFRGAVDAGRIRYHSSAFMDHVVNPTGGALTGMVTLGSTHNNVVAIPTMFAGPDYTKAIPEVNAVEVHEDVHVWQFQSCPVTMHVTELRDVFNAVRGLGEVYDYKLEKGKDLLSFTSEQQATIITDYFLRVSKGQMPENAENVGPVARLVPLYEQTLARFKADPTYLSRNCNLLR
jgi:hypothetical protein